MIMDPDLELDLEIVEREALEDAYQAWLPEASARDWDWILAEEAALRAFDEQEDDALIDDCRGLADLDYRAYRQTQLWQVRAARAKRWHICARCGDRWSALDAHHKTYARFKRERPSDLEALCRACHAREHGR